MGNSCICTSSTARDTDDDWRTHRSVSSSSSSSMTFQKESRQVEWRKESEDEKKVNKRKEDENKADKCSSDEDLDEFLHKLEEDRIAMEKIIFAKFLTDEGKLCRLSWRPALPSIPEENPEAFFRPWVL